MKFQFNWGFSRTTFIPLTFQFVVFFRDMYVCICTVFFLKHFLFNSIFALVSLFAAQFCSSCYFFYSRLNLSQFISIFYYVTYVGVCVFMSVYVVYHLTVCVYLTISSTQLSIFAYSYHHQQQQCNHHHLKRHHNQHQILFLIHSYHHRCEDGNKNIIKNGGRGNEINNNCMHMNLHTAEGILNICIYKDSGYKL